MCFNAAIYKCNTVNAYEISQIFFFTSRNITLETKLHPKTLHARSIFHCYLNSTDEQTNKIHMPLMVSVYNPFGKAETCGRFVNDDADSRCMQTDFIVYLSVFSDM